MPPQLRSLIGVDLLFCVKILDFNFRSSNTSFTVGKTYPGDEIPAPETPPPTHVPLEPSTSSTPSEELLTCPQPADAITPPAQAKTGNTPLKLAVHPTPASQSL